MPTKLDLPGTEILWRGRNPSLLAQMERERHVLSRITTGHSLAEVLHDLLVEIETSAANGLKTSILELSEDGLRLSHLAGPSIPSAFKRAIDGVEIGEGVGSCGTAAHRVAPVYVSDIANDPLWRDYRRFALRHNLLACWSTPIHAMNGDVLGTFAIYYDERCAPSLRDIEVISAITLTVALAIERHRSDTKIRRLRRKLNENTSRMIQTPHSVQSANGHQTTSLNRLRALLRDPLIAGTEKQRLLTETGKEVLRLARLQLEENNRLLDLDGDRPVRLGVGSVFIDKFMKGLPTATCKFNLSSGICFEVAEAFANNELDMAYVLDVKDNRRKLAPHIVAEHRIELAWVKVEKFMSAKGKPIPLAVYPGDRSALDALRAAGSDFEVAFSSKEYLAKISAVKSGNYVTPMPLSLIEPPFLEFSEHDFPPIPPASILIAVRGNHDSDRFKPILSALSNLHV